MADITHITSPHNPRVGFLRALHTAKGRAQEQSWLIEGPHLLWEGLRAQTRPTVILYDPETLSHARLRREIEGLANSGVEVATATTAIIARVAETQTPQGIVAALPFDAVRPEFLRLRREERLRPITLALDGVQDPGNVGTILRSALAADVDAVYLTPQCADPFAPKVVRSASGAHFHLPLYPDQQWDAMRDQFGQDSQIVIADSAATDEYAALDLTQPTVLIIGSEAHGLSPQARQLATRSIHISMYNGVESLNAAIAASIILFESVRQRGTGG